MANTVFLKTHSLTRDYGNHRGALSIDLEVKPGEIVGFIGPNGAGKTTALRMIMGLLRPDKGAVEFFDQRINTEAERVKALRRVGFLPSENFLYPSFSAKELFKYAEALYSHKSFDYALKLAKEFDLDLNTKVKKLSLGNQKKVGFILALMHKPELLILDEPTSGLDPLIQQKLRNHITDLAKAGSGVLLSSHVLSEVQEICDRIVMIKNAEIVLNEKTSEVLRNALKIFRLYSVADKIKKEIKLQSGIEKLIDTEDELIIYTSNTESILKILSDNKIYNFYLERTSLEEMFLDEYATENARPNNN